MENHKKMIRSLEKAGIYMLNAHIRLKKIYPQKDQILTKAFHDLCKIAGGVRLNLHFRDFGGENFENSAPVRKKLSRP